MRFKLSRRPGDFGRFNPRNERHGPELVPAADLAVHFRGTKRDIEMFLPLQDKRKIADVFYDEHKHLQVPFLNPIKIARTPENVTFRVWDQATKSKAMLEFEGCRVKNITIELHDKFNVEGDLLIQLHDEPEKHSARLRLLSDTTRDFELEAQQEEIFDDEPEPEGEGTQPDLVGSQQGGEEEESETDDDDDE